MPEDSLAHISLILLRVHLNAITLYQKLYGHVVTCLKSVGNYVVSNYRDKYECCTIATQPPLQATSRNYDNLQLRGGQPTISRHFRNGGVLGRIHFGVKKLLVHGKERDFVYQNVSNSMYSLRGNKPSLSLSLYLRRATIIYYSLTILEPLRNDSVNTGFSKKGQMLCKSYKCIENNEYYDVSL